MVVEAEEIVAASDYPVKEIINGEQSPLSQTIPLTCDIETIVLTNVAVNELSENESLGQKSNTGPGKSRSKN